jgi:RNA polymerase sigma-70 factor, ECF subfamily
VRCDDLLRVLTEYAEGVATGSVCEEIERHLEGCSPCAELRRDLDDLARLCRQVPTPELPAQVRQRIEALLRNRSAS